MWLCSGIASVHYRVGMDSTVAYSADDLLDMCKKKLVWPCRHVFLEIAPNEFIRTNTEKELRFACEIVSRYHSWLSRGQH